MGHVEPDHERAGVVVGAGADRLADRDEAEEGEQRGREHDRGGTGIELGRVDDQRPDLEAVIGIGGLHRPRIRAEHDQERVGDDDRQRHQQQKLAVLGPGDEWVDQRRLQRVAKSEQHCGDRHQHDQRVEMEPGEQHQAMNIATVIISPWAKLTTRTTPKMRKPERHQGVDEAGQNRRRRIQVTAAAPASPQFISGERRATTMCGPIWVIGIPPSLSILRGSTQARRAVDHGQWARFR